MQACQQHIHSQGQHKLFIVLNWPHAMFVKKIKETDS